MSRNLNAQAERFVLSIKSECLERIVPLGEGHLRHDGEQQDVAGAGRIVRREWLGALLSFYHRKTAVRERIRRCAGASIRS
jgi:hypothetical protein